jgi:Putative zinc-finger
VTTSTAETRCERTRTWAALAPDGELAVLERRLLDAHLAHCVACRSFADEVAAIAAELRAAAAERTARRLVLPGAPVRRTAASRIRAVGSVAAVAAMALGIAGRTPLAGHGDLSSRTPRPAPADVARAELQTIRLFRLEEQMRGIAPPGRSSGRSATNLPERTLR